MIRRALLILSCISLLAVFTWAATDATSDSETRDAPTTKVVDRFPDPAWVKAATRPRPASQPGTRPVPQVDHVVIISIDGCRPDLLLRADAKNLKSWLADSTYTFWARTTPNSVTLPSHTSMLTGVDPRRHGIEWNRDLPLLKPVYPAVPTIFYYAKRYGYTTGMAAGKSKFDTLNAPETIDHVFVPKKDTIKDTEVARAAVKIIAEHHPNLMFVHLPGVDNAGHKYGWGTKEQCDAIVDADRAVLRVTDAIAEAGMEDRTVIIVTADHGGAGKNHGPDDPRSRHIPWICHGPGVRKAIDLTVYADLEVHTEDTFATACWLLGIPMDPKRLDGKPIIEAFKAPSVSEQLLKDVPAVEHDKSVVGDENHPSNITPDAKPKETEKEKDKEKESK